MLKHIQTWFLGFREGLSDFGMTYDDDSLNETYDHGRNVRRRLSGMKD